MNFSALKIGILGGMGALAGARVFDLLIRECVRRGAIRDRDFPEIVVVNIPSYAMDETGVTNPKQMKKELRAGIGMLNRLNMQYILIACNSVHVYHRYLQNHSRAMILHVTADVQLSLIEHELGVLSSRSTREANLYASAHQVSDTEQTAIDKAIDRAIRGDIRVSDKKRLYGIIDRLRRDGAKKIILGCTELPLLVEPKRDIVDPMQFAIRSLLE